MTDPGIAALDDLLVQTFAMLRAIAENNLQAHPEARVGSWTERALRTNETPRGAGRGAK